MRADIILNNPNEGDKFAYWGEWGDAFGPGLAVLRDWSRASRLHASRAILIAGKGGAARKLFERGVAAEAGSAGTSEIAPHKDLY